MRFLLLTLLVWQATCFSNEDRRLSRRTFLQADALECAVVVLGLGTLGIQKLKAIGQKPRYETLEFVFAVAKSPSDIQTTIKKWLEPDTLVVASFWPGSPDSPPLWIGRQEASALFDTLKSFEQNPPLLQSRHYHRILHIHVDARHYPDFDQDATEPFGTPTRSTKSSSIPTSPDDLYIQPAFFFLDPNGKAHHGKEPVEFSSEQLADFGKSYAALVDAFALTQE